MTDETESDFWDEDPADYAYVWASGRWARLCDHIDIPDQEEALDELEIALDNAGISNFRDGLTGACPIIVVDAKKLERAKAMLLEVDGRHGFNRTYDDEEEDLERCLECTHYPHGAAACPYEKDGLCTPNRGRPNQYARWEEAGHRYG